MLTRTVSRAPISYSVARNRRALSCDALQLLLGSCVGRRSEPLTVNSPVQVIMYSLLDELSRVSVWRTCIIKTLIIQDETIEIFDNLLTHLTSLESKPLVRGCIRKRSYVAKT